MEEAWAELEQWGTEPELNELDAFIWRTERVPDASWTGVVVMLLDTTPGFERMEQLYQWGTRKVPRMRDRVVDPVVPVGRPMWEPDPHFDVRSHLSRVVLPAPGTLDQLMRWAERMATKPLDRARPPWRTWLVEGSRMAVPPWSCRATTCSGTQGRRRSFSAASFRARVGSRPGWHGPSRRLAEASGALR